MQAGSSSAGISASYPPFKSIGHCLGVNIVGNHEKGAVLGADSS